MPRQSIWYFAKILEAIGMVIVLVGLLMSISYGMEEQGLKSMVYETKALGIGGALFIVGWFIENRLGTR